MGPWGHQLTEAKSALLSVPGLLCGNWPAQAQEGGPRAHVLRGKESSHARDALMSQDALWEPIYPMPSVPPPPTGLAVSAGGRAG